MSDFFVSIYGKILVIIIFSLFYIPFLGYSFKKKKLSPNYLTYSGICICISFILSTLTIFKMPLGGSITPCSMLFIMIIGYWFGVIPGIVCGVAFGLLQLIINPYIIHPFQIIIDYPVAFGALGLSGLFYKNKKNGLVIGILLGGVGRLFFAFLSGIIFFGSYTLEGINVYLYSFIYNATYILPEILLIIIVISIPVIKVSLNRIGNNINK